MHMRQMQRHHDFIDDFILFYDVKYIWYSGKKKHGYRRVLRLFRL